MDIFDCLDAVMDEPTVDTPPPPARNDDEFAFELLGVILDVVEEEGGPSSITASPGR